MKKAGKLPYPSRNIQEMLIYHASVVDLIGEGRTLKLTVYFTGLDIEITTADVEWIEIHV